MVQARAIICTAKLFELYAPSAFALRMAAMIVLTWLSKRLNCRCVFLLLCCLEQYKSHCFQETFTKQHESVRVHIGDQAINTRRLNDGAETK
tara:strand:+ start:180 stop:455 length:276 start_codon:yes stop_codon:yes gene_type:complete